MQKSLTQYSVVIGTGEKTAVVVPTALVWRAANEKDDGNFNHTYRACAQAGDAQELVYHIGIKYAEQYRVEEKQQSMPQWVKFC